MSRVEVVWLGHSTVDLRIAGARFLTDPLLRDRVGHLRRFAGSSVIDAAPPLTATLVSHLHHDHLDLPSLRRLPAGAPVVVPRGAARVIGRDAKGDVIEVDPGDEVVLGDVRVVPAPAAHAPTRALTRHTAPPLGYLLQTDTSTTYFAGDTDLHPVMHELPAPDLALLPIWGWGSTIGSGHLDPARAVEAALALRARAVLPIHWGTFAPLARHEPSWLRTPGDRFRVAVAERAPHLDARVVPPGRATITFD